MSPSALTAIVADDEELPRTDLRQMLAKLWPELNVVAECEHGFEARDAIESFRPSIAFLDIRMPGMSGVEVARTAARPCHVVFTTAYDSYAIDAFDAGALDYLLKPVNEERLHKCIQRLRERIAQPAPDMVQALEVLGRHLGPHLGSQLAAPSKANRLRWVSASVAGVIKMIPVSDILFFESDEKYTRVVTAKETAHIRMSLRDLLAGLDNETFWQIHRGTVIQADKISCVRKDSLGRYFLEMTGSTEKLRISQAYAGRFKAM